LEKIEKDLVSKKPVKVLELVPELGIQEGEHYTLLTPPSKTGNQRRPQSDLRNLLAVYGGGKKGKIIIPINCRRSRNRFEFEMAMRIETLISFLESYPDKVRLIITSDPRNYQKVGFYDKLFSF